MIDTNFDSIL